MAGGTVAVAASTVVGEAIAVPAAAVEVTGAFLIADGVGLYGIISNALRKSESTEPSPSPQAATPEKKPQGSNNEKTNTESNTTERGTAGKLEKSPTGKGTAPPSQRAKQRVPSAKEKAKEREDNDNKCASCGNETKAEDTRSHHYPDRHADGGDKTVPVCKDCHTYLRSN